MGLVRLPYDIISCITGYLDADDLLCLSASCKDLSYLSLDNGNSRSILEVRTTQNLGSLSQQLTSEPLSLLFSRSKPPSR